MQTRIKIIDGLYWNNPIVHDPNFCKEFVVNKMFLGLIILSSKAL
ncbi:MAG: hypothetical protein P8Y70_06915 [Candidatus Lokiarchaeota archaeon]